MLVIENHHIGKVRAGQGERIFLLPGQLYFGNSAALCRTLLGSCVSITLWRRGTNWGGMCHYLLPERSRPAGGSLDGRYGEEAMEQLVDGIHRSGARPEQFEAQVYGGADSMPGDLKSHFNIGERNVAKAWSLLERFGFALESVDVGGTCPRTLTLELSTGRVQLKRGAERAARTGSEPASVVGAGR